MYKKLFYLLLIFVIDLAQAQEKLISGIVSDASGQMPGVSINIKGTNKCTESDFDGKYAIKANVGDVLTFNFLDYKKEQRTIKNTSIINVFLKEDANVLDEIVVVGYGTSTSTAFAGSSSFIRGQSSLRNSKRKQTHQRISKALKGQVAGVTIINKSGQPGSNTTIRLRGYGSVKRKKEPLYIVDGVPINRNYNEIISTLKKEDIKKVNVYKSFKAKSIFGNLAKNGCIVITTKNGNYRLENDESYAQIHENKFKKTARSLTYTLILGFIMDMMAQQLIFGRIDMLGVLLVALVIIVIPYSIARGLTNRIYRGIKK